MISTKILVALLFGHLLVDSVGSACVPLSCLPCDINIQRTKDECRLCRNSLDICILETPNSTCTPAFQVNINCTDTPVNDGDDVTLPCVSNLPPVAMTYSWKKDGQIMSGKNQSQLFLSQVFSSMSGSYSCVVNSTCGSYESPQCSLTVQNNMVILLVVCGISALLLIVIMGLAMKFKLKRDNDKHRERRKQRVQDGRNGGPAP